MAQRDNLKQLLRLLGIITGTTQSLKQVTSRWNIDPDTTFTHDTELSGKVISGDAISLKDYYHLIQYPDGDQFADTDESDA